MKIILLISLAFSGMAFAANEKIAMDPKQAEMMKAWQEASTPGTEHAMLKTLVGKWKVTTKSWQSENSAPEVTSGTSTFKAVLGGRFVQQDFKGKMMGQSYEGTGMMGFNNVTKKFESSWHDSMSTASMRLEGTFNPTTKVIGEEGEYHCPIKKSVQKMRSEFKIIDKNNATFTMFVPDLETGKEFKGMEQVYKRM